MVNRVFHIDDLSFSSFSNICSYLVLCISSSLLVVYIKLLYVVWSSPFYRNQSNVQALHLFSRRLWCSLAGFLNRLLAGTRQN